MDRFSQLALSAARMAEADSGIDDRREPDRVGAAIATGIGGLTRVRGLLPDRCIERGPDRTSPLSIVQIIPNMAAAWVSMELGAQGPLAAECTACAASNMAIGDGLDAIRLGRADVMFCGGTEAPVTRVGIAGFSAMRALSQRNDDPKAASRPFDSGRDGFVMGEAGGRGRARGARARARPWREDLRRAARLRRLLRRDPRHRARSERDESGARDDDGVRRRRDRARRGRLRQRARDVDPARRLGGDARAQARSRRGEGVSRRRSPRRRARPATASAPPARSRRSSPSSPAARRAPADDQLRGPGSRRATSTTSRTRRARRRSTSASPTRSASAATTRVSCSAAGTRAA